MINTGCCELMEVFEQTITKTKRVINDLDNLRDEKNFPTEFKNIYNEAWSGGAFYFSYLLVDKLFKEDRLCPTKCLRVYDEMTKNFDKIYNITNQINLQQ